MPVLPQDFITAEMRAVFDAVRADGGRPLIAGGAVRDAILGHRSQDTDIEVFGISGAAALEYALSGIRHPDGFSVNWVGRAYGVFAVRFPGGASFDVSLPRQEFSTGSGHREFEVLTDGSMSFARAAARRDFTVNALMADPETGEIMDFHGGLADLAAGVLRHTSAAFGEDPLRVLRGAKFAARYGFTLDPATAAECRLMSPEYPALSAERVWGEFADLAVRGTHISRGLAVLAETGWECWFPELAALHDVPQDPGWHPEGDVWTHSGLAADQAARFADETGLTGDDRMVIVLAALCHDFGKPSATRTENGRIISPGHAKAGVPLARAFLERISAPRRLIQRVEPLVREHMNCATVPTKPAVRRLARRLAPAGLAELALVIQADASGRGDPDARHGLAGAWLEMARDLTVTGRPARSLLTGRHLIAAGLTPGPEFKAILARALEAQDDGAFTDEAGAVAWLTAGMSTRQEPCFQTAT